MTTYDFTLAFRHVDLNSDELVTQLAEGVPQVVQWLITDGEVRASVLVDASDPVQAALGVVSAVRRVAPSSSATHVVEDLVAIPDIAERVGVSREAVRHWVNGTRGRGFFPRPTGIVGDKVKIWRWAVVNDWLRQNVGLGDNNSLLSTREVALVNQALTQEVLPEGLAVGVGITPDRIVGILTDHTGRTFAKRERPMPSPGTPQQAVAEVVGLLNDLRAQPDAVRRDAASNLRVLGVHVGGHVNQRKGQVVFAPRHQEGLHWAEVDLARSLERATSVPTLVQNDANALALYERYFGLGRTVRTFVVVLLNRGIGAGIIIDGQLFHGWQGAAGEIGHLVVGRGGFECTCGNSDCLECVAGTANLVQAVGERTRREVPDLPALADLAEHEDQAQEILRCAGEALGRATSMVLNLVNPSHLVLYGPEELVSEGSRKAANIFMGEVRRSLEQFSFSNAKSCAMVPKTLKEKRVTIGAAVGALASPALDAG
jgi:predicted NBD/HSP70 family sugar kinase